MFGHLARAASAGLFLALLALAPVAQADDALDPSDPCFWQTVRWAQLTETQQELLGVLGWTEQKWESDNPDDFPPVESKAWDELSDAERLVNEALGMTRERWDSPSAMCN